MSPSIIQVPATCNLTLRPYQVAAIQQLRARIRAGKRRVLVVAPTGSGKTCLAAHIIHSGAARGSRTLFIAHRRELINQAYRRLLEAGLPETEIGVIMANDPRRRPMAAVQVASVDTLRTRPKPHADVVFIDETHRALAKSYLDIVSFYPNAIHLGLTATPFRGDGQGLGDIYEDLVVVSSPRELIALGYLLEPRVFTVPYEELPDLSSVRVVLGDYNETQLQAVVDQGRLVGNIVAHWLKHASGTRTVAFAVSIAHSRHIVQKFLEAGVPAEHLDGTTPTMDRDAILARLDAGKTLVASNVGVLCEGWDQPSVKCAILARPTKSTGLYLQQAGRILRPWQGQGAIILDHAGCALEHGLPQDDRAFTLLGVDKRDKDENPPPVKVCKECFAVLPTATRICPHCGAVLGETRAVPNESSGELVEVTEMTPRHLRLRTISSLAREAVRRNGGRLNWAMFEGEEANARRH